MLEVSSRPEIWSIAPTGTGTSFVFRFNPDIAGQVAMSAQQIKRHGIVAQSPFDPDRPLVDWTPEQLNTYRERVSDAGIDPVCEAKEFLSPYLFPLPIDGMPPRDVDELMPQRPASSTCGLVALEVTTNRTSLSASAPSSSTCRTAGRRSGG